MPKGVRNPRVDSGKRYRVAGDASDGKALARADGSIEVLSYVVKDYTDEISGKDGDFSIRVTEIAGVGGEDIRTIFSFSGDPEITALVARRKLAQLRKEDQPDAPEAATADATEDVQPELPVDVSAEAAEDASTEEAPTGRRGRRS